MSNPCARCGRPTETEYLVLDSLFHGWMCDSCREALDLFLDGHGVHAGGGQRRVMWSSTVPDGSPDKGACAVCFDTEPAGAEWVPVDDLEKPAGWELATDAWVEGLVVCETCRDKYQETDR